MKNFRVAIAGGGVGGLTAALSLARIGCEVTLYEQAPEFSEVGAGLQLAPNCTRVLHHLGLEEALRGVAFLPQATQFRDWRSGRVIAETPLGEDVQKKHGGPYYHIHRGDLLRILVEAAESTKKISLQTGVRVEHFCETEAGVQLSVNGLDCEADLLVGADGIHSVVRAGLWGERRPRFTGNVAWRALVPADCLPDGLIKPMSTVWWGPGKHFVNYYLRRGELVNCVCVVEKEGWEVESWTERGDYDELRADFAGWHDDVQQLIEQVDRDSLFKWALYDRAPLEAWGRGRVTLLGDACHPTLPFMAQGAAMAIEDAAVLASCLAAGHEISASLARYEDLRRRRTAWIQNSSRRNAEVYHMSGIQTWFRNKVAR
ncbi:MAG: NAD-binding protein, partial [Gammaproteobacteria bacterium]|nr:NAD-binding protein [Gammaproteobacteria bacterium]